MSSQAWGKLYRADLFVDVRFPDGHVFEDIATRRRLVMRVGRVACVPGALVNYREREGSISTQHPAENLVDCWRAYLQRCEEISEILQECRQACMRGCFNSISRTWCWWVSCPVSERASNRGHIDTMRRFARDHTREVLCGIIPWMKRPAASWVATRRLRYGCPSARSTGFATSSAAGVGCTGEVAGDSPLVAEETRRLRLWRDSWLART